MLVEVDEERRGYIKAVGVLDEAECVVSLGFNCI